MYSIDDEPLYNEAINACVIHPLKVLRNHTFARRSIQLCTRTIREMKARVEQALLRIETRIWKEVKLTCGIRAWAVVEGPMSVIVDGAEPRLIAIEDLSFESRSESYGT